MKKPPSERRLVENEAVFRQYNRHVQRGFEELQQLAKKEGEAAPDLTMPLHFYCECSDENCRLRISLSIAEYKRIHQNKKRFFVIPGHQTASCEFVVNSTPRYTVVQKYLAPPTTAVTLNSTPVHNV
nr:Unknown Function [uncultured bacterium]